MGFRYCEIHGKIEHLETSHTLCAYCFKDYLAAKRLHAEIVAKNQRLKTLSMCQVLEYMYKEAKKKKGP